MSSLRRKKAKKVKVKARQSKPVRRVKAVRHVRSAKKVKNVKKVKTKVRTMKRVAVKAKKVIRKVVAKKSPKKIVTMKAVARSKPSKAAVHVPTRKPAPITKLGALFAKPAAPTLPPIGKVIHYYDRIGVAIVDLHASLKIGDRVKMRKGDAEFTQEVTSLQVNHQPVPSANRGQVVGMKVSKEAKEGTVLLPA